jgi:hypothetical protein
MELFSSLGLGDFMSFAKGLKVFMSGDDFMSIKE